MTRPHDLPPAERFAHGTRARYTSGCRCDLCREANCAYQRMRGKLRREGISNGLVDAAEVRAHLLELSKHGIGRRTVSDIAGVPSSAIGDVLRGAKTKLRLETAKKLFAVTVDAMNDAKLVDARPFWKLLRELMEQEDFTRAELAKRLGYKAAHLQFDKRRITAKSALRIERFYRSWQAGYSSADLLGRSAEQGRKRSAS